MLAPLRDYLRPQDPMSSPLLCTTKDHYFNRMSIEFNHNKPVFRESRWIVTEDINVEHLVDVFTSVDADTGQVWGACADFFAHLYWHKPRYTVLRVKVEGLPDDRFFKPICLLKLAELFKSVGNQVERKRLLNHTLKLLRERGGDHDVAEVLRDLSDANRMLGLPEEGIQQAKEALEIYQRLGTEAEQVGCLNYLGLVLQKANQLNAAKEAASLANYLVPEKGHEFLACQSRRLLGDIYRSMGERTKAIPHLEAALAIASPFGWHDLLFWIHYDLALLFLDERQFDSAHARIEQAKSHTVNDPYRLGRAVHLHAIIWFRQSILEEAKSEALCPSETFENFGAVEESESCRTLLQEIERITNSRSTPDNSDSNGELLK